MISGAYSGDSGHNTSSGSFTVNVRPLPGMTVLLTFTAFDVDDFDNGVGQLNVLVNNQLVVDIPAGLNHLTGSGDFKPYEGAIVNFGPFDITSFIVNGQNTILFKDPDPFDHFGIVSNVTIVQGGNVLLQVLRARGVFPAFSFSYTFSNPPLSIVTFAALNSANQAVTMAGEGQLLTFAVAYSGGTGPFRCVFSFGDGEHVTVAGSNRTCSATHQYDSDGTFNATVMVKGSSTSDRDLEQFTISVS